MISTVPAFNPVTTPDLLTLAMVLSEEFHGSVPSGIPEPARVSVAFRHTLFDPVMVGNAFTVKVIWVVHPSFAV